MNRRIRILIAVKPRVLARVISHLLASCEEVEVVCWIDGPAGLVRYAQRLLPHLIIVNRRFVDGDARAAIQSVKAASPGVKLLLTTWSEDAPVPGGLLAADARLNEDALVGKLVPVVRRLCGLSASKVSQLESKM